MIFTTTNNTMNRVYTLMHKAEDAGRFKEPEQYQAANAELKAALDALTDTDIVNNARVEHPILHECAQQLTRHPHIISPCLETFKLIWCHPKLKHLWADRKYRDTYGYLAEQRLATNLCNDTSLPAVQWIMTTMRVRPVTCTYTVYGDAILPDNYKL